MCVLSPLSIALLVIRNPGTYSFSCVHETSGRGENEGGGGEVDIFVWVGSQVVTSPKTKTPETGSLVVGSYPVPVPS